MLKLSCPSCGGDLDLPDNLEIAHCLYCGTKIFLSDSTSVRDQQNLKRYVELCKTALEAKNYDESLKYCNNILEIDPNNVEAWIDKAVTVFWLTTVANNRYCEAIEYLNKAQQIMPNNQRINDIKNEITCVQLNWSFQLGTEALERAKELYRINHYGLEITLDNVSNNPATIASESSYKEAMNFFLAASELSPSDTTILYNILACSEGGYWIHWSNTVEQKIQTIKSIKAKQDALEKLPQLEKELSIALERLKNLKNERGFFAGRKINEVEEIVRELQAEIARLKKDLS